MNTPFILSFDDMLTLSEEINTLVNSFIEPRPLLASGEVERHAEKLVYNIQQLLNVFDMVAEPVDRYDRTSFSHACRGLTSALHIHCHILMYHAADELTEHDLELLEQIKMLAILVNQGLDLFGRIYPSDQ